ncbi:MAG: hypothetical protein ACYCV0_00855 [Desulfitobacteriaceae bacterium]
MDVWKAEYSLEEGLWAGTPQERRSGRHCTGKGGEKERYCY